MTLVKMSVSLPDRDVELASAARRETVGRSDVPGAARGCRLRSDLAVQRVGATAGRLPALLAGLDDAIRLHLAL